MSKKIKFVGFDSQLENEQLRLSLYEYNKDVRFLNLTEGQEIEIKENDFQMLPSNLLDNGILVLVEEGEVVEARKGFNSLSERMDSLTTKLEFDNKINNLLKKELYIDITAPPTNTGLLPLTLSDPIQDAIRLQAIFDYVKANEYSFAPDGRQAVGYTFTLKFPKGIITLGSKIIMKGQFLNLVGDGTVIKTTHSDAAFESTGSNGRKLSMEGFVFIGMKTAINMINTNIDCSLLNVDKCWFYTTTNVAVKIDNQSTMAVFHQCHWYHCRFIFESITLDQCVFDNCWFSELPRQANYETSFILRGNYTKFRECFFIPSGYDRNEITTTEPSLIDIAWIATYASVEVDGCRVSSEPNSKTLINSYVTFANSPYNATLLKVTNNYTLSATQGECVVRLFNIPNKIDISNNNFVRLNDVPIKYGTGFDVNAWLSTNSAFTNVKIEIKLDDNMGQSPSNWECPSELKKFLRFNHLASGMIKKDTDTTSAREGAFSNTTPYFDITSNIVTSSGSVFPTKMFLVKLEARPSNGQANYRSFFLGIVSFSVGTYDGVLKAKVFLNTLVSNQGGSSANQATPIAVTATFVDTGVDTTPIVGGSTAKYAVRITWTSSIDSTSGKYTYKEVMDGAFLF